MNDYTAYRIFTEDTFRFLGPLITNFHKNVRLEVDPIDMVTFSFAKFRRPTTVHLYLYNIMSCASGQNMACSLILIALTHELLHSEQYLIQNQYNNDSEYRKFIEGSTNKAAYKFIINNRQRIRDEMGFDVDLSYFNHNDIPFCDGYRSCNLEEYYKLLFMNVILRNPIQYQKFADEILDKYPTVFITFDRKNNFLIKSNGEYCRQTLDAFIRAIDIYASRYDYYTMCVKLDESSNRSGHQVVVILEVLDKGIYPAAFVTQELSLEN